MFFQIACFVCIVAMCSFINASAPEMSESEAENVAALDEDGTLNVNCDCVLSLNHICTCGHKDHYGYKNEIIAPKNDGGSLNPDGGKKGDSGDNNDKSSTLQR